MIINMDDLINYIGERWLCTPARYPEMEGMSNDEKFCFVLRHTALHFAKTAGKIAGASENADHGEMLNIDDLKTNTAKSLINTLYLAGQLKMTSADLEQTDKKLVDSN